MSLLEQCIIPDWPAPASVRALQTTRQGGVSLAPYDTLNLGLHVGDDPMRVNRNRQLLAPLMPSEPVWLEQVHGTVVANAGSASCQPQADACVARHRGSVCVVMTADCLPVLLCDEAGTVVGAVHAGWRGLAAGVIEATVEAMGVAPQKLMAWFGPAIGPEAFEVGAEVREAFMAHDAKAADAFLPRALGEDGVRVKNTTPTSTCLRASVSTRWVYAHQWRQLLHLPPERQILLLPPRRRDRAHGHIYVAGVTPPQTSDPSLVILFRQAVCRNSPAE